MFSDNGSGADDAINGPLTITEVNGQSVDVGIQITLVSGALLTLTADGSFTYIPNEAIPEGEVLTDSFIYTVQNGLGETESAVVTIEVAGQDNNDVLTGTPFADTLEGGQGDDIIDGLGDQDTASYSSASSGVTVDLRLQGIAQDTSGAGFDTLINIENLTGSDFDDSLTGDDDDNTLRGNVGADTLSGNGGNDTLLGGIVMIRSMVGMVSTL